MVGCSSAPTPETNYYLLNNQQSIKLKSSTVDTTSKRTQMIILSINDLPEYLAQPYLVMQMADHQLHYANFHMWAEPLQKGMSKTLLHDLNNLDPGIYFVGKSRGVMENKLTTLFVNIDYFHASSNSKVVLSGQYWLSKQDGNSLPKEQNFYFERQLEQDGYPHSVAKLRMLLTKLAEKISNSFDN